MRESEATNSSLRCYRCGSSLEALSLPLSRLDLCPGCGVELHVCRMCVHFAPTKPDACDEEDAVEVQNKTSANFCDYFTPSADAFDGSEKRAEDGARAQLDALFGEEPAEDAADGDAVSDDALEQAESLFRK